MTTTTPINITSLLIACEQALRALETAMPYLAEKNYEDLTTIQIAYADLLAKSGCKRVAS